MDDQKEKRRPRWQRLKKPYHLIVRNRETFEEVYTIKLSLLNAYLLISTVLFVVVIAVMLLFFFTPLKTYVPGYGELESNAAYMSMYKKMTALEEKVEVQNTYIEGFRRMITADVEHGQPALPDSVGEQAHPEVLPRIPEDEIIRQNVELSDQLRAPAASPLSKSEGNFEMSEHLLIPPVEGIVSLDFTPGQRHYGIDILAPEDSPVKAVLDGYVISSGWNMETGNTIALQHSNNLVTFYKHNASLLKNTGDFVRAGEAIAIIGNTGKHSDGPHLHFEMWLNGQPLNPRNYILSKRSGELSN